MQTTASVADYVAALTAELPIEDIWLLEAGKALECYLDQEHNLILITRGDAEPHKIEQSARDILSAKFGEADVSVHAFSLDAITRIPRPLLVKMALQSGENIYCG